MSDHDRYDEWDAAYVLGALSAADRREFEDHLAGCPRCAAAVAELAAMPGLLAGLSASEGVALLESGNAPESGRADALGPAPAADIRPPAQLLPRMQAHIRHRRRVRRWTVGSVAAALAAAATVVALTLPGTIDAAQHPSIAVSLQQETSSPVSASVRLTRLPWGTAISLSCTYHGPIATNPAYPIAYQYGLYVVDRVGTATRVSSWNALPDRTITTEGSTATPTAQIVRIELRDLSTGTVLLARNLG